MLFNANKLKVQLKLAVNRLKLLQNKKNAINSQQRREIATLLEKGKEESARIRVEHIIREDYSIEAMEMMEIYCEMLLARFGLIEQMKQLDPSIHEAACSVVYSAPRCEVQELHVVKSLLGSKYGRDFIANAAENKGNCVNERLINKLKVRVPDPKLVTRYLVEIAKNYNVAWNADESELEFDSSLMGDSTLEAEFGLPSPPKGPPSGKGNGSAGGGGGSGYGGGFGGGGSVTAASSTFSSTMSAPTAPQPKPRSAPTRSAPAPAPAPEDDLDSMFPTVPTTATREKEPPHFDSRDDDDGGEPPKEGGEDEGDMPDFDELTRRFEALKKRQ